MSKKKENLEGRERFNRIVDRAIERKNEGKYNDVLELMNILVPRYMEETGFDLDIASPFGGIIKFTRFNRKEGAKLQIKLSTAGDFYPGSESDKWTDYSTFTNYLDSIDKINNRDYGVSLNDENLELKGLSEKGIDVMDKYDNEEITQAELEQEQEKVFNAGLGRKVLAKQLLQSIKYHPTNVPQLNTDQIPNYLNGLMQEMGNNLGINQSHEIDQQRAASVMFGVALCELFRTPGSMKHFRQCLRIVRDDGTPFSQVFGNSFEESICFLSPTKGTKKTRDILAKGLPLGLTDDQRRGWDLSDSSDDEDLDIAQPKQTLKSVSESKAVIESAKSNVKVVKKIPTPSYLLEDDIDMSSLILADNKVADEVSSKQSQNKTREVAKIPSPGKRPDSPVATSMVAASKVNSL